MKFKYTKDKKNIVTITMSIKRKTENDLTEINFISMISAIKKLEHDNNLNGIIITSSEEIFFTDSNLEMIYNQEDPEFCFNLLEKRKSALRSLELINLPTVAAINGTALGGGMELALCCNHRVVLDNSKAKFGFPEVDFGILPSGGVTRLPRMIGIEASLPFLVYGKQVNASDAVKNGLIDEIALTPSEMMKKAREWIFENKNIHQPWDQKDFKFPKGNSKSLKVSTLLENSSKILRKKTRGNYPAPESILSVIAKGSVVDFDAASRIESRFFANLATNKTSKNMIQALWFQLNKINSGISRPNKINPTRISKVGVLGSGLMGHGIAYATALAGIQVVMADTTQENADMGLNRIKAILMSEKKKKLVTEAKTKEILNRITTTNNYGKLEGCDLVIEAVFEDRNLKGKVIIQAEKYIDKQGVFASNTSTIPITFLAKKSYSPDKFIGIHFFSPVHKMKLVEIIKGEKTSPNTLAKAFDYILKIKKIPIVVNDSPGFYTTRVFERYTNEGLAMIYEGQNAESIEAAGRQAGFPVGPLAIIDEININLAAHIRKQKWQSLEEKGKKITKGPWDFVINFMIKKVKRTGRAEGNGFYEYPKNGIKYLWADIKKYFPLSEKQLSQKEMIDRFYFSQAIETIRCYEEGVINSVADANIGSIFGWGFASFKGGTLQFVNDYGIPEFMDRSQKLADQYGNRFTPPQLLHEMVMSEKTF